MIQRGKKGARGSKGEKGKTGGSSVFVTMSNQEVWNQFKSFQESNEKGHCEILKKIQDLDDTVTLRIDAMEKFNTKRIDTIEINNSTAHEKIKGSINLISLTVGSAIMIGTLLAGWIINQILK